MSTTHLTSTHRPSALLQLASRNSMDLAAFTALKQTASTFTLNEIAVLLVDESYAGVERHESRKTFPDLMIQRVRAICAVLGDRDAAILAKLMIGECQRQEAERARQYCMPATTN